MAITDALMYARSSSSTGTGTGLYRPARAAATRSNFFGPKILLTVAGTSRSRNFDRDNWEITERRGDGKRLSIEVFGFTPAEGDEIVLGAGSIDNRLFRGTITRASLSRQRLNEGRIVYRVSAIDWTYDLALLVTKRYTNQSATAIAQDLVSTYAPAWFTSTHVQTGLATIDEISYTMQTLQSALQNLADRIGGYFYWDADKDLHFFITETTLTPEDVTSSNPHPHAFKYDRDIEDVRNKIFVEGLGTTVRAPVAAGSTTIPVDDVSMFESGGGTNWAKLQTQLITYTGVAAGSETGSSSGYVSAPAAVGFVGGSGGSLTAGATYLVAWTYTTSAGETTIGPTQAVTLSAGQQEILSTDADVPVPTDPLVTAKNIYVSTANGDSSTLKKYTSLTPSYVTPTIVINSAPAGGSPPSSNSAGFSSTKTAAGSTSLTVEDLSVFPSSGWAEAPGGQVFSYTGRSASSGAGTLTGIPASGVGSLTAEVRAGTVRAVPHLTGVPASGTGAIAHNLVVGEDLNILVIAEDATSQSSYGVRELHVQDRRLSLDGSAERGAAELAIRKDVRISGTLDSSDPKLGAGKPLTINCWGITATVTIQALSIRPDKDRPQPMCKGVQFASRTTDDLYGALRQVREHLAR